MEWLSSLGTFGDILRGLIVLIEAIFVLNLLIVVHEWGHFLAARWRGLKIEKFYVWFGKPLWKKTFNGVEYGLGSIPLGGFVQLPQMGPMGGLEGEEEKGEKLAQITPLDKIIVAFAGPLFSFLLAVVFAYLVFWIGMPDRRIHTTTIGWIDPQKPAGKAGFQLGDKIIAVDGREVHSWDEPVDSVKERIAFSKEDHIEFTVERAGQNAPVKIKSGFVVEPGTWAQRRGLRTVGILWAYDARVFDVRPGSAAERAGLMKGDVITGLDGKSVHSPFQLYDHFKKNPQASAALTVKRGSETVNLTFTPLAPVKPEKVPDDFQGIAITGLLFEEPGNAKEMGIVHPLPSKQLADSSTAMFRTLGAVTGRKGDVTIQQMGGPVKILNTYTMLFQIPDGWRLVLWFSVLLNVNLAIMNLFPFPVFDGGHIVMAFGEWIRKGSLLPTRIMEGVQFACVALLLCFFVYVTWFDVNDLVGSGRKKEAGPDFKIDELVYPAAK